MEERQNEGILPCERYRVVWNKIWENDPYSDENLRKLKARIKVKVLLSYINPTPNWHVVDLGCGAGHIPEEIYNRIGCKVTGIDFSEVAIGKATKRLSSLPIVFNRVNACNTDIEVNSINLVVCCGVIEHIPEAELCIKEIYRILRQGGLLFMITSNKLSTIWPHRLIKRALGLWKYGYQRNWTHFRMRRLLRNEGFEIYREGRIVSLADLKSLAVLDIPISRLVRHWGRYVVILGRKI